MPTIIYQSERTVEEQDSGLTLLEISLRHGIPHAHACGGHARCSTCRVMVLEGASNLSPVGPEEEQLAAKKSLTQDTRLACQTRASGPVRIRRLVLDETDAKLAISEAAPVRGREAKIAVLFTDLVDFTPFADQQLPYDVVHILNRYFYEMGEVVLRNEGYIDKYIGDALMALFGLETADPRAACAAAVTAGCQMLDRLKSFNAVIQKHFGVELGMRIGIHYGDAVVGSMGHPRQMQFTAIGDTVNVASRVEGACKGTGANLLVTDDVYQHIAPLVRTGVEVTKELKGKKGMCRLREIVSIEKPVAREEQRP